MVFLYIDLFCGAGGTSTGIESARINAKQIAKVILCINHNPIAIASHKENHPDALHCAEDIRYLPLYKLKQHIRKMKLIYPEAKVVLWASPDCTHFSKAKGGQSRDPDSRTLARYLYRYIEVFDPDYIQIENVEEFESWGPLIQKECVTKEGYSYSPCKIKKHKNGSITFSPVFIPDPKYLALYYKEWVNRIKQYGYNFDRKILNAADYGGFTSRKRYFAIFAKYGLPIVWPQQTHIKRESMSSDKNNYSFWKPVKDVLDLNDIGKSLFSRAKPLCENTLFRLYQGLIEQIPRGNSSFISAYNGSGKNISSLESPSPTVTTKDRLSLISAIPITYFIDQEYGNSKPTTIDKPLGSLTTNPKYNLISCLGELQTNGKKKKLPSHLRQNKNGNFEILVFASDSPITVKIKGFMAENGILEIYRRMLKISEIKIIMGFPENYILKGTQTDQKKFLGNAVEVNMAKSTVIPLALAVMRQRVNAA